MARAAHIIIGTAALVAALVVATPAQAVTHKRACAVASHSAAVDRLPEAQRWGVIWCRRVSAGRFRAKTYFAYVVRDADPEAGIDEWWLTCWQYVRIDRHRFGTWQDRDRYLGLWYGEELERRWWGRASCGDGQRFPHPENHPGMDGEPG